MRKFTTGVVLGGIMALAGAEYMMMNKSAKNKIVKKGKKVLNKAENVIDDISSDIW
ncbi:MAG: hypothetical protein HFE62_03405 [Firmicutes bacterium]|nr:hypothetical protein [Bacillota bacterium]